MKKLFTLFAIVTTLTIFAQAPQGFNYQATVRNSSGQLLLNQIVLVKFNILKNSATETIVYSETQTANTDDLGQINLVVGQGTASTGTFSTINWGSGSYYLGIELNTGSGYVAMGATQLMSVPYALNGITTTQADAIVAMQAQIVAMQAQITSLLPTFPTNGLLGYWPFNGNANDESGNGNNGTVNGTTLTTDRFGNNNKAYSFNGTSNNINIPSPFLGGGQTSVFSYYARVNFNSLTNSPNIWGKTLFWGEVNFYVNSNGAICFTWANSITGNKYSSICSNNNIVSTGNWYDIAIVFENSIGKIYVNGNLISTNLNWGSQGGGQISSSQIETVCNFAQDSNSSKFGSRVTSGVTGAFLNGKIDDIGIWNRALTQQEITALYNSTGK